MKANEQDKARYKRTLSTKANPLFQDENETGEHKRCDECKKLVPKECFHVNEIVVKEKKSACGKYTITEEKVRLRNICKVCDTKRKNKYKK